MKSRMATSICCSFVHMNLGGRILASMLLAVIATAAAGAQSDPAISSAEARKAIETGYADWTKARMALDMNTIEKMLAPDFYFQLTDRKVTRQEFVDRIRVVKITRFDIGVLTVEPRGNDWSVVVSEKGEIEKKDDHDKTSMEYIELVARDGWRKLNNNQWTLLSSEVLGRQEWHDTPPVANW